MPFYEYIANNTKCTSCIRCQEVFEVRQSIMDEPLKECRECLGPIHRIVSLPAAFLNKNREANQYNDIKAAKYWRDKDGNRHRVQPGDGGSKSPTVTSRRKRSDEQVKAIKKQATQSAHKHRLKKKK